MLVGRYNEYEGDAQEPTYWIEFLWRGIRINGRLFDHFRTCRDFSELDERAEIAQSQPSYCEPKGVLNDEVPCCWRAQFRYEDEWLELKAGWHYELPSDCTAGEWTTVPRADVYRRLEEQMRIACRQADAAWHRQEMRNVEEHKAKMIRHPDGYYYPAK